MDKEKLRRKIDTEDDFINYPRYGNSIKNLIDSNPNGVDNKKIGKSLMITEQKAEEIFRTALAKIRKIMGV